MLLFSKRLKETRIEAGLTQAELGAMVGVTKVSVCCYEKGTRTPTLDTLVDLANALNVDFSYLLGQDGYAVAEQDDAYGINFSKEEIQFMRGLRRHKKLYEKVLTNPNAVLKIMAQKIR